MTQQVTTTDQRLPSTRVVHNSWAKIALHAVALISLLAVCVYAENWLRVPLISLYGVIALGRVFYQVWSGSRERQAQQALAQHYDDYPLPKVTILVPTYNEPIEFFRPSIESLVRQDHPDFEIIVIDDGSENGADIRQVCYENGVRHMLVPHGGKREALYAGYMQASADTEFILTTDSDTTWETDAARKLIIPMLHNQHIGATTGYVAIRNRTTNLLTKMVSLRYWIAFNQERAAASYHKAVNCVSGPLGAYRREALEHVMDDFISQQYAGSVCTYGDDRHLTNLTLLKGWHVGFSSAVCYTDNPTTLRAYIRQQLRWSRSFWREMFWQVHALDKHHIYMFYDLFFALFMPLFLLTNLWLGIFQLVYSGQSLTLHWYALTVCMMGLARVIEPMWVTRDPRYLYFVVYGYFHFLFLLPVKLCALLSLDSGSWGSRLSVNQQPADDVLALSAPSTLSTKL